MSKSDFSMYNLQNHRGQKIQSKRKLDQFYVTEDGKFRLFGTLEPFVHQLNLVEKFFQRTHSYAYFQYFSLLWKPKLRGEGRDPQHCFPLHVGAGVLVHSNIFTLLYVQYPAGFCRLFLDLPKCAAAECGQIMSVQPDIKRHSENTS